MKALASWLRGGIDKIVMALFVPLLSCCATEVRATDRSEPALAPNIVLIVADDLGYGHLGDRKSVV